MQSIGHVLIKNISIVVKYEKQCVLSCCETLFVVCMDKSKSQKEFSLVVDRDNTINKEARKYDRSLFKFDGNYWYFRHHINPITGQFNYKYYITTVPKFCSCSWFLDRGSCRHLVAVLILAGIETEEDREFAAAITRGRPKLTKGALKR